ncbi:MAG TPA: hypothetical protein VN436_06445 [Holophaga sp.]|nr:hypothetical protein [Holophaga sp.]
MTWQEDLRHLDWNGRAYTVLDRIEEEGRIYLGLAPSEDVAGLAQARDRGGHLPVPPRLTWVEEQADGFRGLSSKEGRQLVQRRLQRASRSFRP